LTFLILSLVIDFATSVKGVINMKSTGMIRQLDPLGRVVLPIELRRTLDINPKDTLEIYVDGDRVILQKYEPNCYFCGSNHGLISYKDKQICKHCLNDLKNL